MIKNKHRYGITFLKNHAPKVQHRSRKQIRIKFPNGTKGWVTFRKNPHTEYQDQAFMAGVKLQIQNGTITIKE